MLSVSEQKSVRFEHDRTKVCAMNVLVSVVMPVMIVLGALFNVSNAFADAELQSMPQSTHQDKQQIEPNNIALFNLSNDQQQALVLLGKVWGFGKYFHADIAKGKYFWDQELYQFLPKYLAAVAQNKHQELLLQWLLRFTNPDTVALYLKSNDQVIESPKLQWIQDEVKHKKLNLFLRNVLTNRAKAPLYYVEYRKHFPSLKFTNELTYVDGSDNAASRVIGLFRFWNQVNYFHSFNSQSRANWQTMLGQYLSLVINADNQADYGAVYLALLSTLNDADSQLLNGQEAITQARGTFKSNIDLKWLDNKVVVISGTTDKSPQLSPLKVGDLVVKINQTDIDAFIQERLWQYPGYNRDQRINRLLADALISHQDSLDLVVEKYVDGSIQALILPLSPYDPDKSSAEPNVNNTALSPWLRHTLSQAKPLDIEGVRYISAPSITLETLEEFIFGSKNSNQLIVDLRGFISRDIAKALHTWLFVGEQQKNRVQVVDLTHIERSKIAELPPIKVTISPEKFKGNAVFLIDHQTMKFAEHLVRALQPQSNIRVLGSLTAGATSYSTMSVLPGGLSVKFSTGAVVDGNSRLKTKSVKPDVDISQSLADSVNGEDSVLKAALAWLQQAS